MGDANPLTTIPLPSAEAWKAATANDHDLKLVMAAIQSNQPLIKKELREKGFFGPWERESFEIDDGCLYYYEHGKRVRARQIRVWVVPKK